MGLAMIDRERNETELNELIVVPSKIPSTSAVTTATPVANWPRAFRNSRSVKVIGPFRQRPSDRLQSPPPSPKARGLARSTAITITQAEEQPSPASTVVVETPGFLRGFTKPPVYR
jgi:hypothetical protein